VLGGDGFAGGGQGARYSAFRARRPVRL